MTQEDKNLLLKDLCARLPYSVWGLHRGEDLPLYVIDNSGAYMVLGYNTWFDLETVPFKPYLRPMSSMTEDEREEIEVFIFNEWYQENSCKIDKEGWIEILANYDVSGIDPCFCSDYVDWLNEHHFDYRGLIEKGLALEAPKDMYKTE